MNYETYIGEKEALTGCIKRITLLVTVTDAIHLCMIDRVIGLASAGRAYQMKQQYFYVEKKATVQIITRIIVV